jgi:putative intracellular protease/amidase
MKTYVLYSDGFAEFEIIIAVGNLAAKSDIIPVALEMRPYISEEKQTFSPARPIEEIDPGEVDVFLIPGGTGISALMENARLGTLLGDLDARGVLLGAICGGVQLLGRAGLLDGRRFTCNARGFELDEETREKYFRHAEYVEQDVVVDRNIVTAMAQAFVEFGTEIADQAGLYATPEERERDYRWIKNLK